MPGHPISLFNIVDALRLVGGALDDLVDQVLPGEQSSSTAASAFRRNRHRQR
jgi:hypothetical protein